MFFRPLLGFALITMLSACAFADEPKTEPVRFREDILPILSDNCFPCHGPDKNQRKAKLRLDLREGILGSSKSGTVVAPRDLDSSELWIRISDSGSDKMPPPNSGLKLSSGQIEKLRRWIEQGAEWNRHWSLVTPTRPAIPAVKNVRWIRNPIDAFILARIEQAGLTPSPEASAVTLLRRLSFDITGLPPSPKDVFRVSKQGTDLGRFVDRYLGSPRFGDRMTSYWLDAARYADTSGYQNDGPRYMWRWRDWVINAWNENQPYDQFVIDQLAGDLIPGGTLQQRIATGFNRNHRGNAEGGIIPEEYAVEYVVDRVNTTATVFLGMTWECGRCHDHKFDPFSQREFYQIYAYFNNVPEYGRAIKEGNSPPFVAAPTEADRRDLHRLETQQRQARQMFARLQPKIQKSFHQWQAGVVAQDQWSVSRSLENCFELNELPEGWNGGETLIAAGKLAQAVRFDGNRHVDAGDVGNFGYFDKFSFTAWVRPDSNNAGTVLSRMTDVDQGDGYSVQIKHGQVHVNLVKRWLDDSIRIRSKRGPKPNQWTHLAITYDGSRVAKGIKIFFDAEEIETEVDLDGLNQTFASTEPFRIGAGGGPESRFVGAIDEVRVYSDALYPDELRVLACAETIDVIVNTRPSERNPNQRHKLFDYFLSNHADGAIRDTYAALSRLRIELRDRRESVPTVMVMEEMSPARETHVLVRGEYNKPGERVAPGVPKSLPAIAEELPANRLGFAHWLIDPANPLTARVAVNRIWFLTFGTGLVPTLEDFGVQGQQPSHPKLLDWLAVEFIESGWDVKHMLRLIVDSATYRQLSIVTERGEEIDPANRLYSRAPRFRLPAEVIRDRALAGSGLLVERFGGPSVKPYQPDGLWKEIATDGDYQRSRGAGLYRRSVYTYWKRTVSPPTMVAFDASTRETCTVREPRTNTPLQALTLLNEVTFVEAARVLAQEILSMPNLDRPQQLDWAFARTIARTPTSQELHVVVTSFEAHRQHYEANPEAARKLLATGDYPAPANLSAPEHAALTAVCNTLMNLDEFVTRE